MKYQITSNALLIRKDHNRDSKIVGVIQGKPIVSVLSVKNGYGRIENGWIDLKYAEKAKEGEENEKSAE